MYSAMSSIPLGGSPGRTRTQELWYSLRGTDARLESVLSTDECLCDACCARFSTPNFVVFVLVFWTEKFFVRTSTILYGRNKCLRQNSFVIYEYFRFFRDGVLPLKKFKNQTPLTCNTHKTLYTTFCKSSSWRFPMRIITLLRKVRRQKRKRNQIHR